MNYPELRNELEKYYYTQSAERSERFRDKVTGILDEKYAEGMSPYAMKVMQYKVITENFQPVLFPHSPFYYEMGTIFAESDGTRAFHGHTHAGGWTFWKNSHKFIDRDPALYALREKQGDELFYLICGEYNDHAQHFDPDCRIIFEGGFKGIYEKAMKELSRAETEEQKEFLSAVAEAAVCAKRIAGKFASAAEKALETETDPEARKNYARIADAAKRVPWEKPNSFYEALNVLAFVRVMIGALEGVGPNTFGRADVELYPFYKADTESGKLTREGADELIRKFLITWDKHYDHDKKMIKYSDHELENTYVLGGCDDEGNPVFNELTKAFLVANREEKIIYPKIKCRYSANSPKEYLDEIDKSVIKSTSTVLYCNDDAIIPAVVAGGKTLKEARDYIMTGCWGINCNGVEKIDGGMYVNILKPFEYSVHKRTDKMKEVGMNFLPIDDAESFEEVYRITLENIDTLFKERSRVYNEGGKEWNKVDPLPLFSSLLHDCVENRKDFTAGGARYNNDNYLIVGFPNLTDSLLVIKELCFDKKIYRLKDLLSAVRNDWVGCENMRLDAIACHGWGDGSRESCEFADRFNTDLYNLVRELRSPFGGRVIMGHLTYTEVRWWGEKTLATPDGRKNGDYIAQGLTPSRLKHIPSSTDVVYSMSKLGAEQMSGNTVTNLILPTSGMTLERCERFLRAAAHSSIMSLQLNVVGKEQLLDAQAHPEKYPDLIVRVTGFSARFTALSPEWQKEVLTRNFYER